MAKKDVVVEETTEDTKAVDVGARDPNLAYSDHFNQKFGNTPANPKHAPGSENDATVLMGHKTNNIPGVGTALANVPERMVGDYARAGWHVSTGVDDTGDDVGQGEGPTDDKDGQAAAKLTDDVAKGKVEATQT